MDNNELNPLVFYDLYKNGQFLTIDHAGNPTDYIDSNNSNLIRTHLLPVITTDQFYEIYN